ncbi:MAG: Arc family DNA-binding protein [Sphingomonadales bacterium]|nr:MAG: Arc family DNA-binding protein [Sphingomonadales bacterium]
MTDKPIREYDRFILRLPDGMREKLQARATLNDRSMNSEVTAILAEALGVADEISLRELKDASKILEREEKVLKGELAQVQERRMAINEQMMRIYQRRGK